MFLKFTEKKKYIKYSEKKIKTPIKINIHKYNITTKKINIEKEKETLQW